MHAFTGGQRREMAETVVARGLVSIALACRAFGVSETYYRYGPKLRAENEEIADLLVGLTEARKTWGFGLCFLHLRNVQGRLWKNKRVYRIYCELELDLRIKPRRRSKRDKPDALVVLVAPEHDLTLAHVNMRCRAAGPCTSWLIASAPLMVCRQTITGQRMAVRSCC